MKKNILLQCTAVFFFLLLINKAASQTSEKKIDKNHFASPLDGAWQRVYYFDGTKTPTGEPKELALLYDGFFSSVGQDSTNRWISTHVGTYEISGNTIKTTLRYSSHADRIGSIHWVDYELKGDTLIIKWFKKLVTAQGQDITAQMAKGSESKYVKAKK